CSLACHKKCLENLLITCGHKKLPARVPLFGVDFAQVPRDFPEEVPFLVVRCTSEIEARALGVQGIYRVSGSKCRVEKLCQAFESGRGLVELSEHSPHDITGVLKHFLKELSSPVLPSNLYDRLMALAKDLQRPTEEKVEGTGFPLDPIQGMKDLLSKLPGSNYNTLRHLIAHLYRVAENYQENKMSPNNLGIVFGPTLIRPGSGTDVSMSCLVDSGYQAQIVEFLIHNYEKVFGLEDLPSGSALPSQEGLSGKEEGDRNVALKNSSSRRGSSMDSVPDDSSSREAEATPEGAQDLSQGDTGELSTSVEWELEELENSMQDKMDNEVDTAQENQPKCHFSRQPAKYIRAQLKTKPNIPKASNLSLRTSLAAEPGLEDDGADSSSSLRDVLEENPRGRNSPTDVVRHRLGGKQQHKHFEITQETARIISKFKGEDNSVSQEVPLEREGSAGKGEDINSGTYL
ncbi:PREDICTED: GEM-interacting protein-like, partial [Acanthisitta chloris]|uniref:GEM-interacting protein-like n=1 Tax=Acanthisitta chloris TaxID=57068 RepID=UPI0004F0EE5D